MKFFFTLFLTALLSLLLVSCDNECCSDDSSVKSRRIFGAVQPPLSCTGYARKEFVYKLLHDSYLWAETTPFADFSDDSLFADEEELLNALKDKKDRFSFIIPKKEYDDYFVAGKSVGFGFSFVWRGDRKFVNSLQVILVYPGSNADKAGLKRSDLIVSIDGYTIDEIYKNDGLLKRYFGFGDELDAKFALRLKDGGQKIVNIKKSSFDVKSVIKNEIFERNGKKIGYLLFQSFTGGSKSQLKEAFAEFEKGGIDELVLDLRYNGGGYVYIANLLASMIGGKNVGGKIFLKRVFNASYSSYDRTDYFFKDTPHSLSLRRVFIITTQSSCSASELVINSLKASVTGVEVIQIGDRTCGKPYGMIGGAYCDRYILPVQMKNLNADASGEYINGLIPDCRADDGIGYDFGDMNENSLKAAIFYIENNRCENVSDVSGRLRGKIELKKDKGNFRRRFNVF